jgi:hypothetical protein
MSDENVVPLARAGEIVGADVARLAAEFPDWEIGADWITANSGSDHRFLWARRHGKMLAEWNADALARQIRRRS